MCNQQNLSIPGGWIGPATNLTVAGREGSRQGARVQPKAQAGLLLGPALALQRQHLPLPPGSSEYENLSKQNQTHNK